MTNTRTLKKPFIPSINLSKYSFISYVNKKTQGQEISWFRFGFCKHIMLSSVETIEHAGKLEKQGLLDRQAFNADYIPILGEGAFTASSLHWGAHKRNIMRYLTPSNGNDIIWRKISKEATLRGLEKYEFQSEFDGLKFCRSISQETIIEVFFGTPTAINKYKLHILTRLMLFSSEAIGFSLLFFSKHPTWVIKPPQMIGKLAGNILSRMVEEAPKTANAPAFDSIFRRELRTLLFAGHETMTCALMSCLWIIGNNKKLQNNVYKDIHNNGATSNVLKKVILESLRLLPPLHTPPPRICSTDININDETIPAGSVVFYGIWQAHRRCKHADHMQPDRFSAHKSSRTIIPFGVGPKRCVGEHLSLVFLSTVISEILTHVEITSVDNSVNLNPRSLVFISKKLKFVLR